MTTAVTRDSPWAPMVGLLPPEVGRSLGPWLDQLAAAIGPLRARARTGTGAPDGFEGLSLRGPYDRLVLSEWALADVLPEEFVRRAAQGEHAFYQLARRDEARAKTSVALFDPGPLQLGGPRIGQLAALLVLAGRAQRAGAMFGWATIQRPPEAGDDPATGLRLGLDAPGLRGFLLGRTAFAPTAADLDAWLDRARRGDWEDLWIIGPPGTVPPGRRLAGVKTPVGRIEIADVFEADARSLDVTVVRGAHRRALRVDLPPEALCKQLLHGGIAEAPKPPPPVGLGRTPGVARPISPPILLADGRKVAFLDAGESVTVYTVPDIPSPRRGRYHRFAIERDHRVIGLGWTRRRLLMVSEHLRSLHVRDTHGDVFHADAARRPLNGDAPWDQPVLPAALTRVEVLAPAQGTFPPSLAFIDNRRRLIVLDEQRAVMLYPETFAATSINGRLHVVVRDQAMFPTDRPAGHIQVHGHPADAAVVASSAWVKTAVAWRSVSPGGDLWNIPQAGGRLTTVALPAGDTVLGLISAPVSGFDLGLIALSPDRRALRWISPEVTAPLFTVTGPVLHASATPRGDRVALLFEDGTVEVWALPAPVCLLRVAPPA